MWLSGLLNSAGYLEKQCGYCVHIHIRLIECLKPLNKWQFSEWYTVIYVTFIECVMIPWTDYLFN